MSALHAALREHARRQPERVAIADHQQSLGYRDLLIRVLIVAERLQHHRVRRLALFADNGLPWVLADLAAHIEQLPLVPLPLFFSPPQILHALADSGVDAVLTDQPAALQALLAQAGIACTATTRIDALTLLRLPDAAGGDLPDGTAKITYTSGTTGEPKGVCLGEAHMAAVAASLIATAGANADDRHLCLTPLSTLLENLGGVHVPLLAGASVHALPLAQVGLSGASGLQVDRLHQALVATDATSAILAPQMLAALVGLVERGAAVPRRLRFVAVGGAPVAPHLLQRAVACGLPVYEGYGLSECASVLTLNAPGHARPGSQGRPLPHARLRIADDGEVWVDGPAFLGYLGHGTPPRPWPTGDLGELDADGYLHLRGRRKNVFITSFGRNVSPDWVESELTASGVIAQAAVFGEARPFNVAVIVPTPGADDAAVAAAIAAANARLPDYARVRHWLAAAQPFAASNGQLTANGRLKRPAIAGHYQSRIDALYQEETNAVF